MAFCYRSGQSKLKILSTHLRRCYVQLPHSSSLNSTRKPRPTQMPYPSWGFHGRPTCFGDKVRFFAAPVQFQAKPKNEDSDTTGRRLNDEIKAQYVRLVLDDDHFIVSRFEALERARKLKLDLVEVQRNANPPVCKIMDFHKEKYKQQEKEKERAKSKADSTLRKGQCKEVRFSEKTELKDLKVKADMVKKLMEKGYRVKCRASGNENQDLQGALSRLLALIEDISLVESGPHSVRKEAYMVVRHVKYGPSKKGGCVKKLRDDAHKDQEGDIEYENQSSAESGFETEDEVLSDSDNNIPISIGDPDKIFKDKDMNNTWSAFSNNVNRTIYPDNQTNPIPNAVSPLRSNDSQSPEVMENRYRRADRPSENKIRPAAHVPLAETENRYRRTEPRNRFQQTTLNNTGPNYRGPGLRDAARSMPSNLNQMRQVPVDTNFRPRTEDTKQAVTPGLRNSMPDGHGLPHPGAPNNSRPGYGIFSAPNGPDMQGVKAGMHRNREGNS